MGVSPFAFILRLTSRSAVPVATACDLAGCVTEKIGRKMIITAIIANSIGFGEWIIFKLIFTPAERSNIRQRDFLRLIFYHCSCYHKYPVVKFNFYLIIIPFRSYRQRDADLR